MRCRAVPGVSPLLPGVVGNANHGVLVVRERRGHPFGAMAST